MEQKRRINARIEEQKNQLGEKRTEEFNMDEALDSCFSLMREGGKTWKELHDLPAQRARFQKQAFPEKVTFDGKEFVTPRMALVYEINQQSGAEKSKVVPLLGLEPHVVKHHKGFPEGFSVADIARSVGVSFLQMGHLGHQTA